MTDSQNSDMLYEVADHIATITFNRPEQQNTISRDMLARFSELLLEADATEDFAGHALLADLIGHAIGDHVDDAGAGAAAVAEDRRAADDLDSLRGEGVDRDRVVRALSRYVLGPKPILEDLGPVRVLPADHGSARAGGETAGRDAREAAQGFAEGRAQVQDQLVAFEDVDRDGKFVAIMLEGVLCAGYARMLKLRKLNGK